MSCEQVAVSPPCATAAHPDLASSVGSVVQQAASVVQSPPELEDPADPADPPAPADPLHWVLQCAVMQSSAALPSVLHSAVASDAQFVCMQPRSLPQFCMHVYMGPQVPPLMFPVAQAEP